MTPQGRRLFLAGSTGAVGRTVLRLAEGRGLDVVPHARPRPGREEAPHPRAAVFELADREALAGALGAGDGRTTILQLVGTMRRRFAQGDTYESSDVGTTRQLALAARGAGVDHLVLLSSVGAGRPIGAYLRAKARAEAIVRDGGVPWTIVRPGAFVGEGHRPPPGLGAVTRLLGLRGLAPIAVEDLARALLLVAIERAPLGAILEGASLWETVARARSTLG